jgi:Protein of unknown function (DUF2281).
LQKIICQLQAPKKPIPKHQFGSTKGLLIEMSDDFDAPLDDFQEYVQSRISHFYPFDA